MSRWDIFRWRTLAGGRWCPVGTVQRRPRRQPRPLMASSMPRRFPPSFPVQPPQACAPFVLTCRFGRRRALPTGELRHKRRRGDTGLCGALASCPLSRLTAPASRLPPRVLSASGRRPEPTDAAAETGCWATSHWDVTALFQKAPPLRPFAPKLAYFSGFMCTSSWG